MRHLLLLSLLLASAALFGYSAYRAANLSFVHDESLSYSIIAENTGFRYTANNHLLNTAAMDWAYHRLGDRELYLRLGNVLAHALYLIAGLLILRKWKGPAALLGFGLLNLNPFLLDFFGLARGYGIASGLSLVSLFLLQQAWNDFNTTRGRVFLFSSSMVMALAVLGNFAWLNLQLAFLAVAFVLLLVDYVKSKAGLRNYPALVTLILFVVINSASVVYVSLKLLDLQRRGGLEAGSDRGLIMGTLNSLTQFYFYGAIQEGTETHAVLYSVLATVAIAGLWLIFRVIRERSIGFSGIAFGILFLAGLAVVAEEILLHTFVPFDRSALYYVPILGVLMASVANDLISKKSFVRFAVSGVCVVLTIGMIINFAQTANLTHTFIWGYDANTKNMMTELEKRVRESGVQSPVTIGNDWLFEPSINYYRLSRKYTWLEPADRQPPTLSPHDFLYGPIGMVLGEARKSYSLVKQYPDTGTELLEGPRIRK